MEIHGEAKKAILDRFGQEAYPHRINMADLPAGAELLFNPVTNIPGFYLEKRFFFVPGFPSMAHPMILEALDKLYPQTKVKHRLSLKAFCSENDIIETMEKIPSSIDCSSLPQIQGDKRAVVISVASYEKDESEKYFQRFIDFLKQRSIKYILVDK
jgi:molybdopterin-biosynthesis enzyme MoeA-like protein